MDLSTLLTKEYIFSAVPPVESRLYLPLSIFFGLLVIAGFLLLIFTKDQTRKTFGRYTTPSLLVGFIGLINLGSRYEQLPWLSSRFILVLAFTILFTWFFVLAMTLTKAMPQYKKELETNARYDKYLPKPKQKGKS